MGARNTPAAGYPIIPHAQIESLREDLRIHSANDERELATIRGDVKGLLVDTSEQTSMLVSIQANLSTRFKTEEALTAYERKKKLRLWGALLSIVSLLAGAAIHHLWP